MALESATYIDDLNVSNPSATDNLQQGDDHIRLIKSVLKATFPNITGAVEATQTELGGFVPSGGIIMWSGTVANIPSGWYLCDGANGTPDLTGRFVVHADADSGGTYAPGDTGGNDNITLTEGQLPAHGHGAGTLATASDGAHSHTAGTLSAQTAGNHDHTISLDSYSTASGGTSMTAGTGGSQEGSTSTQTDGSHTHSIGGSTASGGDHTHDITGDTADAGSGESIDIRPAYYALAYIMKA